MLRNPIVHSVNVTYVVAGMFAQKPLVPHDFFALRRRFTVQAGLCRDRLHQSRRTQSLRRLRRAECPSRFHTLCNMPRNGFFSSPKTEREIATGTRHRNKTSRGATETRSFSTRRTKKRQASNIGHQAKCFLKN